MLGDARLTDEAEVPAELVRVVRSARFLVQLTAGPAVWWMYPDEVVGEAIGGGARWGVRRALWDQRMGVEATAMALLAGCDVLDAAGAPAGGGGRPRGGGGLGRLLRVLTGVLGCVRTGFLRATGIESRTVFGALMRPTADPFSVWSTHG